jgi:2-succinyl-5-enolpyruvyl-6-hydroxy-3-cyclohexene-1-carboxylate synthase
VFNNGGGQIFNYIDGMQDLEDKEELFLMSQELDYKKVASMFHLEYHFLNEEVCIESLIEKKRPILLEVKTQQKDDLNHIQRLKTLIEWNLKEQTQLMYQ